MPIEVSYNSNPYQPPYTNRVAKVCFVERHGDFTDDVLTRLLLRWQIQRS